MEDVLGVVGAVEKEMIPMRLKQVGRRSAETESVLR